LGERAETTADTEGGGVVEGLFEAVVVEEDAGAGVDIGEGILGLGGILSAGTFYVRSR
jgi:hypothetical protein